MALRTMHLAVNESGSGSRDLADTAERAKEYGRNSKSAATRLAYASDWRKFRRLRRQQHKLTYLPTDNHRAISTELADAGKSVSTIRRRVAAIADKQAVFEAFRYRAEPKRRSHG